MQDAQALINDNPRSDFQRAQGNGYSFWFHDTFDNLIIVAKLGNQEVASATFIRDFTNETTLDGIRQVCREAHCDSVEVEEPHRRKRLANSLYILAGLILRVPLWNFWEDDQSYQSTAGAALWAQPNRPFG